MNLNFHISYNYIIYIFKSLPFQFFYLLLESIFPYRFIKFFVLLCGSISLFFYMVGCREKQPPRKVERSFYYWKSIFALNSFENQRLDSLQIKTIYLRFFDADWDENKHQPLPKAVVKIIKNDSIISHKIKIIPVVFITNECIQKLAATQINLLADQIILLMLTSYKNLFPNQQISEVQIDCDWSASTRQKYFALLQSIKKKGIPVLSVTIRLHQIKYLLATGVPPADRGLLMCYNMGNLTKSATKNSIIEVDELKKYIHNLSSYPLPLDVGLPLFDWYVLFRNNQYQGLIKTLNVIDPNIIKTGADHYFILKDTSINNIDLKKGDVLRKEVSKYEEIVQAAELLNKKLGRNPLRISFFHLDSVTLKKYPTYEIENIYNRFY